MTTPQALTDLTPAGLQEYAHSLGQPRFTGKNLARWIYQRRARDFEQMTDLSRAFRETLQRQATLRQISLVTQREDPAGTTAMVLRLRDGKTIETVLIPEEDRRTVCVSTQVGCAVGCVFCASGLNGLLRNLSPGEIVEQVLWVQDLLPAGENVTNIVVMGIGEPTMNLPALLQALAVWNDPQAMGIGARRITISTVGYPTKVRRLADQEKEFGLAISLHAPRQDLRAKLLPGAAKIALPELLQAARYYFQKTGRRVTFEYTLLAGINDHLRDAEDLARLLRGFPAAVNLIPVNPVEGLPYARPSRTVTDEFRRILVEQGIRVTRRRTRGDGIAAACGQLRLQEENLARAKGSSSLPGAQRHREPV